MSKQVQKVCNVISTVVVVLAVILALLLVGVRLVGLRPMCVLSGSMEPTYHTGSLIYVKPCAPEDVQVGDAITFVLNEDLDVVTHRVISIDAENEHFYTQGDANDAPDGAPVYFKNLIGRPVFTIPYLGYVSHWVSNPPGMYLAIALVLVVALAVGATWALLTHTTDTVTNTFVVGKLIDANTTFSLKEHAIDRQDVTGKYVLKTGDADSDYTTKNTYGAVVPGVNIPKDPTVKVEKLAGDAYLYVVVDNQLGTGLSYTVDGKWTKLADNGTKTLYVYNSGEKLTANSIVSQGVLANNEIAVGETVADGSTTLAFNAYLVQAVGTGDAAAAWNAAAPVVGFTAVMP